MSISIREAYGKALLKYGSLNEDVVVLDADVSSSTKSNIFGEIHPNRFFNVGVAEANMVSMACGFASAGKIPFCNSFASFVTSNGMLSLKALASYNNLNVKIAGAYSGLSDSYDGPTHHSLEDLAIMMSLPNFTVAVASDEIVTDFLVKAGIDLNGPVYIRLSREIFPSLYEDTTQFEIGKGKELIAGKDVTIIACGVMVGHAIEASKILRRDGLDIGVVDIITLKPLDEAMVVDVAKRCGAIVVAEEHSRYGGLGAEISGVLDRNGICVIKEHVAMDDKHAESGAYEELLSKYQLNSHAVARACECAVIRKSGITGR